LSAEAPRTRPAGRSNHRAIPSLAERGLDLRELDWSKFKEDVFIFIGPEGDFTPEEFFQAKEKGAIPVSLGEAVLRSETAAIYILSILNYELK
ncbi:MAG: RsmE family RNA methyltransferase, partial [Candidatus Omnitrophica bacterium]|nr:RsmE family RNA methyltransferase [Candidatus Omnitrophota bacterium]